MIRALAPELPAISTATPEVSYEERMAAAGGAGEVALPPPPARLFCALGDVTNLAVATRIDLPVHPGLERSGWRGSRSGSPSAAS